MIIELTGASEKIDGFLDMLSCYDIIETCRTGMTGISRDAETSLEDEDE